MNLTELTQRLQEIKAKRYLPSLRKSSTGIGYTFENEMGLAETNIAIPDIGGRVEIKTTRKKSSSLITLFTFNRGVWQARPKDVIQKFGYKDKKGRQALKATIFYNRPNNQKLSISVNEEKKLLILKHQSEKILAEWDLFVVIGVFFTKLSRVLLVLADTKKENGKEFFYFNKAFLLYDPDVRKFLKAIKNSIVGIDLRMHLKESGVVRNHGTGFRCKEADLIALYANVKELI